ncbi:D-altritol 5-dehydrogenase-like [Vanessa cardui]|uniref:D-altritol 5-dehydrogenase-like n=1 Tax=Vanessa cardui TaxID=171605 RepID=UPI001F134BBE|nr:D-altritol 5-dehydrogenase-like [Vanessa cardui]XP_046975921.1 D-altritol 5-dehydrogenase-like [Vanessa cardui]
MKAVVFDGKALTLKYDENYPKPGIVNDTDVIVKVEYAGVCGTDLHIIQGEFPASKERPLPLGHEFSGVVHEVGKGSTFKVGQKVVVDPNRACNLCNFCRDGNYQYCLTAGINSTIGIWRDGGWAQYVKCPQDQVYALPDGITTEQAGLCEPYSCVSHGFDRASPITIGKKILIVGAGIIGNLWITTLHVQGHRDVTVSEMNKSRLDIVKGLGTGYRLVTPDVLASEKQLYDVIVDCTGVGKVMEISFKYLNCGGKYVLFGCCPPTHQASVNPYEIYDKELTLIGVKINPFSFPKAIGLLKSMGDRYLNYEKLGVKTYPLSGYKNALEDLKTGNISKAVFKIE